VCTRGLKCLHLPTLLPICSRLFALIKLAEISYDDRREVKKQFVHVCSRRRERRGLIFGVCCCHHLFGYYRLNALAIRRRVKIDGKQFVALIGANGYVGISLGGKGAA